MRLSRRKTYYMHQGGVSIPCRIMFPTKDGKAVVQRTEPNARGDQSGTEFIPLYLITEHP